MAKTYDAPPAMALEEGKSYGAVLKTNKGDIRFALFAKDAPRTVNNFVYLAREGYYDGVVFHRVIRDFMIQTGDPTGTGAGGPGYRFEDELPPAKPYGPGIVAMANAGPNTNGSQFFICSGPQASGLNRYPNYTVFGQVVDGMDTVARIAGVPVGPSRSGEVSAPREEVKIETVAIEEY